MLEHIPIPKTPVKLPKILSRDEIARLIDGASNLMHRAIVMTLYSTGIRRSEVCSLKVSDIDSGRPGQHVSMATKLSPVPEGYGTLTPYLIVHDGAAALDFYAKVFGAIVGEKLTTPDGRVMHAEL